MPVHAQHRALATLTAALLLGLLGACGPYSASSGRVDQSIKRVAVEYLDNRTQEPDLGIFLADAIIEALQDDNTLKVVSYEIADSVLEGAAVFYEIRSAFISQEQQVDEYQVQIAVELTFRVKAIRVSCIILALNDQVSVPAFRRVGGIVPC